MQKINVLVVDDSAVMRLRLRKILEKDDEIKVIDVAKTGEEALSKVLLLKPAVVTMDVEMPGISGLEALESIMKRYPVPVVMLSALTAHGTEETLKALELGAVDFVQKPDYNDSGSLESFEEDLRTKIKSAAKTFVQRKKKAGAVARSTSSLSSRKQRIELVAIGSSTGGPAALQQIIPFLPADFSAAVVIVQHIPKGFTRPMANRLDKVSLLKVIEAGDGTVIKSGKVYIAPAGHTFSLKKSGSEIISVLDKVETFSSFKPSVDDMMLSAAHVYGSKVLGVVLTGMGNDGTKGLEAIKKNMGKTIAQGENSCVVFGMPKSAIEAGVIDEVVDLGIICDTIIKNVVG
ncbi:MAG: protein-glutamate methylesterase/protein-glutamine glutaminase [Bacillota bacterium]